MRKIKFRAWIPAGHWAGKKDKPIMYYNWQDSVFVEVLTLVPGPNEGIRIMQYTGLKDKNGKEIYEGDVVAIGASYRYAEHVGEVQYEAPSFCVSGLFYRSHYDVPNDAFEDITLVEVIGNIYENPELLERP